MRVNGEPIKLQNSCTLKAFLKQNGYIPERVAVELNGEIVPKTSFETITLSDTDSLELVAFVGGG